MTGACQLQLAPTNTACDDGNACTVGDVCATGLCQGGTNTCFCKNDADCSAAEDGDACNGTLFCNKVTAKCQMNPATVVTCQSVDDTACRKNLCNPKDGKCQQIAVNAGKPCDDGNSCTPNEACQSGLCSAAVNTCECAKDADCKAKEDGNLCNGSLFCDLKTYKCAVNPATVIACDTQDDPQCAQDLCNPLNGKCEPVTLALDASPCNDGNACTKSETCLGGVCKADVNANTCACQKDSDCAAKDDGNQCNGTLYCDKSAGLCVVNPATVVSCSDAFDATCEASLCQPVTGKCAPTPVHQGNTCSDGSLCSGGGWCALGSCVTENKQVCECTNDGDCAAFEDGDLCNGVTYCDLKSPKPLCKLNPATVIQCKTVNDTACEKTVCQPATGKCASQAVAGTCSDGMNCTANDSCLSGKCVGIGINCVDALPCTDDTCKDPFGCLHLPAAATPCDDGNACTQKDACVGGQCAGGLTFCDDGKPCTDDACSGQSGCVHSANSAPCSDGDPCSLGDACAASACKSGGLLECNDGNPCTTDACAKASGKCGYVAKVNACNDDNLCTDDTCDAKLGCLHGPNTAACTDGNPCTQGDTCAQTVCQPKTLTVCSDGQVCTDDACDAKVGCVFAANTATCDDGSICSLKDVCKTGICQAAVPLACDDGNACTDDSCHAKLGCQYAINTKSCDSTACTGGSVCSAGKCVVGSKVLLSDTKLSTGWDSSHLTGVAAYPGGDLFVTGSGLSEGYYRGYAARLGSNGLPAWKAEAIPGGTELFAALVQAGGNAVAVGKVNLGFPQAGGYLCSGDGKVLSTVAYSGSAYELAAAKNPLGGYWLTGDSAAKTLSIKWVDADLQIVSAANYPGSSANSAGSGIVATAGGGALAVGWTYGSGNPEGRVLVVDAGLTQVLDTLVGGPGDDRLLAVARSSTGGAMAAGFKYSGLSDDGWLVALDDKGAVQWQRTYGGTGQNSFAAIAALPDGGFLLAGSTSSMGAGQADAWLVRTDPWGNVHWQRTMGTGDKEALRAVTLRPDYGFAAVGEFNGKAWVLRADAWGNTTCLNSGACLDIGFTGCDDKNPCTMDTCNTVTGCEHALFPVGTRCAVATGCDAGGKCSGPIGK